MKNESIIQQMFSGKRGTYEQVPLSEAYRNANGQMIRAVDVFLETLTPEQKTLFHETYEYISDQSAAFAEDHFAEGFKFGLLLGIETSK